MKLEELIEEMKQKMNRYDLSDKVQQAHIGEWEYGVSYVPCDWVYQYLVELKELKTKTGDNQ